MHVSAIRRYPVKSLRGEDRAEAEVEPWGLAGDRRWMVVDDDGEVITAREVNAMLLVRPTITPRGLTIEADGISPLEVDVPDPTQQRPVAIWSSELTAAAAGAEADAWLSKVMGVSAHLVHLDDPRRRSADPRYSESGDVVSFADGYPLLITTEESLAAVNDALAERTGGMDGPLPMVRFRPNMVVTGDAGDLAAWAEDDWRRIRVGDAGTGTVLRLVKGCARCVMTTVDPETAQRGKEPTATLARIRRFDGATWFGVNAIPDMGRDPGDASRRTTIRVGDPVEILESVPPGAGPIRSPR